MPTDMLASDMHAFIMDVVRQRYPGHAFILFYGSHAHGTGTADSDIDITIVFEGEQRKPFRETFRMNSFVFDAFVYDAETLNFYIQMSKKIRNTSILDVMVSAIPLPGPHPTATYLIEAARAIQPLPFPVKDLSSVRLFMTSLLKDFSKANDPHDKQALAIELYKTMADITLLQHGIGGHHRKSYPRKLREANPAFFEALHAAFAQFMHGDGSDALCAQAHAFLARLGGESREGFRMQLPDGTRVPLKLEASGHQVTP